jgi:hypothetical protein
VSGEERAFGVPLCPAPVHVNVVELAVILRVEKSRMPSFSDELLNLAPLLHKIMYDVDVRAHADFIRKYRYKIYTMQIEIMSQSFILF